MASIATAAAMSAVTHSPPLPVALSGVFGSISLVAWICVILPQLIANFKAKSADGLSMAFLIVWLLGDVTNLLGALFTHLAPTAIALPSYFVFADLVLISQCAYYNARNARKAKKAARTTSEASEDSPLLARRRSSLAAQHNHGQSSDTHGKPVAEEVEKSTGSIWVQNALSLLAVYVVGIAAFFVSYKAGAWNTTDPDPGSPEDVNDPLEWVGLTMGYVSAVFYLCARLPQIWKNYKDKSCEGLAVLFFMLSLTGNLTYGVSLVAYSQEKKYLLNALPFLLGSLGTIIEDCIIFVQFRLYSGNQTPIAV